MVLDENCLFCKIIKKEIPSEVVYEDSMTLSFLDINPRNPGHLLVIPKNHYETIFDIPEGELRELAVSLKRMARAAKDGMKADGVSISQSNGQAAGQVINHMHFHIIPRFLSEGPHGLEAILPMKKMTNEMLAEVKNAIIASLGSSGESPSGGGGQDELTLNFGSQQGQKKEDDPFGF